MKADVATTVSHDGPDGVMEVPLSELPMELFTYLSPSRYCQSDKLQRFAHDTFSELPAGYQRVAGICNWIREYVTYEIGSTTPVTSAFDTVTERVGVCRDFAHLAVALCRAMSIPARYVSAYALGLVPPDFHAAVEAYLRGPRGEGWYLFDPTRGECRPPGPHRRGPRRCRYRILYGFWRGAVHCSPRLGETHPRRC